MFTACSRETILHSLPHDLRNDLNNEPHDAEDRQNKPGKFRRIFQRRYARKNIGWRVSTTAHAGFILDALEQAVHDRRPAKGMGLVHHNDRGSQYLSIRYSEQLTEAGIEPSVGNIDDSYDNALAETINGLFKADENFYVALETEAMAA